MLFAHRSGICLSLALARLECMRDSPFRFFWVVLLLSLPFWILGFATAGTRVIFGLPASALMFVCPSVAAWLSLREQPGEFLALVNRVFFPPVGSMPGALASCGGDACDHECILVPGPF